ncbi:MAG: family 16 glycoside hydrolase [Verrucomicrobiota bacterium]
MRRFLLAAATVVLGLVTHANAQGSAMKSGVTVWVYELGQELREVPVLVDGQTPNSAGDYPAMDFTGSWASIYGAPVSQYYLGHALGRLVVPVSGTYEFRLTSDDGAKFFVGESATLVIDNDQPDLHSSQATLNLLAGSYPFYVDFYQNVGGSRLLLEWKPPGAADFVTMPSSAFETEDGQTHVTSPGLKNFYYEDGEGGTAGGPGDGRPLTGVHPGFNLVNFRPSGFQPRVGGMDFLPDGRLAVCTWDATGAVYLLGNLNGPGAVTVQRFAEGLGEPLGLKVVNGIIYVTQKQEVTKLVDLDADGIADEYEAVAHGWPASFNYHEFSFNLVHKDGHFWITTSVPLKTGDSAYLPGSQPAYPVPNGPGSLLRINEASRSWQIMASGLRTPNGLGIGMDGELFGGDNQGCWMPSSRINHIEPGEFYGHQVNPAGTTAPKAPALWLPHGEISNSPAQPSLIPSGAYAGQMLFAELTHGGINRIFMEKINGEYQGAVFQFTQGLETGMNRLTWGPDGSLYAGGLGASGNWNWNGKTFGLQKLQPNGHTTFEIHSIRSRADGFIMEFTQPVPYAIASQAANYQIQQYSYTPTITYGGPKIGTTTRTITDIGVSQDRRKVFLKIPSLENGKVTYFRIKNFVNDNNVAPWATEAWYTLNQRPAAAGADFITMNPPTEPTAPVPPAQTIIYESEEAARSGVTIAIGNAGYTGTGYADYQTMTGEYVQWTVNATHAGAHTVSFRYANGGTGNRPLQINVNGVTVSAGLAFNLTASWTHYQMTAPLAVTLNKGSNTIRATSTGSSGANVDHLTVTGPPAPPANALVLFDGTITFRDAQWRRNEDAALPNWTVTNGALAVNLSPSPNDIVSVQQFKDFQLHAEWLSPAGGTGQQAGNSGIKLQRSYELQVLNTPASATLDNDDAGAIYLQRPASQNASLGAGAWQSYDVWFTAPRWSGNTKVANARASVRWNGMLIHDDVEIPDKTGESVAEAPSLHALFLQAHATAASGPVLFRNIWVVPADTFGQQWSTWLTENGLTGLEVEPEADSDHDGISNRWEYAMASNPKISGQQKSGHSLVPKMEIIEQEDVRYLQFTYLRRIDSAARGLRFSVETSPTLGNGSWSVQPASEVAPPVPTGDGITEMCTIRANAPISQDTPRLFCRLGAEMLE